MQLEQRPQLQQTHTLRLSPQMLKSLDMLAMPVLDLRQTITHELESNPALEKSDAAHDISLDAFFEEFDIIDYDQTESEWADAHVTASTKELTSVIEHTSSTEAENLHDILHRQLRLHKLKKEDYAHAKIIINNLNDDGFHSIDPYTHEKLIGCDNIADLISLIQTFEPWGICVSNVQESLIVQARLYGNAPDHTEAVVRDYFSFLEKRQFSDIAHSLNIDETAVELIYSYIRALTPYPGRALTTRATHYITPDLEISFSNGNYHISINESAYPKLNINKFFLNINEQDKSTEDNIFVRSYLQQAKTFIAMLHKRNHTLLRTAYALLHRQYRFFRRGPQHLAPLKLQDIAEMLKLHPTTISRIASKKYIQTNWGIYPVSYLFSGHISSEDVVHSKEGVKSVIKEIITKNTNGHLSDQRIATHLHDKGINIARRTVTKYRHELQLNV